MSNLLIPVSQKESKVAQYRQAVDLKSMISTTSFTPRLVLGQMMTKVVQKDELKKGSFGFIKGKTCVDLSKSIDVVPVAWRMKAMQFGDSVLSFYNPGSPEFQEIAVAAKDKIDGNLAGPEFLIWLPAVSEFATFFLTSPTLQNSTESLIAYIGQGTTLTSELIEGKKGGFYVMNIFACTAELALPNEGQLETIRDSFENPKESEVESDDSDSDRAR